MPRPSDVAVAIAHMMVDLALLIHDNDPYRDRNLGAALEQMFVAQLVIAAQGKPLNATEVAERLLIPRTNVVRHLKALAKNGRLRAVGSSYVANLELLDHAVTPERFDRIRRTVTETARVISRTRSAFSDQG